jgi:hypothetical protein
MIATTVLVLFILILGSAFFERLSGDQRGITKMVDSSLAGLILFMILGILTNTGDVIDMCVFSLLWACGRAPGWGFIGDIMGSREPNLVDVEWYRKGSWNPARKNLWIAAFVRGIIWALPVGLYSYYYPPAIYASAAIVIAFPSALLIAREFISGEQLKIGNTIIADGRWGKMQLVLGGLTSILTILFVVTN